MKIPSTVLGLLHEDRPTDGCKDVDALRQKKNVVIEGMSEMERKE